MPPVVYLLCGLTGSGKTTYAKRLEASGAVRLSVDEEVYARHGRYGVDYPMEEYFDRERPVVEELRHRLVELVESDQDVVLDYGLWRRSDRDAYKRLIETHGGRWRLLYFKADREVLAQRLAERNRHDDANALAVTPSALEDFIARFDEPRDEGEELVDSGLAARRPGRPEGEAGAPVTVVSLPGRRAGLEGVEKSLPAPSPARTQRCGTPACFAAPRTVASLVELATGSSSSSPWSSSPSPNGGSAPAPRPWSGLGRAGRLTAPWPDLRARPAATAETAVKPN